MGDNSTIEWTDATWNPTTGCDRVSPGCAHCYALELAPRLRAMGSKGYIDAKDGGPASGPAFGLTLHPDRLDQPLRWQRPRMVFVNSMSDLFHEEVPDDFILDVFATMIAAKRHTFQVLTKRPERMRDFMLRLTDQGAEREQLARNVGHLMEDGDTWSDYVYYSDLLPAGNVWLGVTIENRRFVDRADLLRETPAAVRFVSAEPLLSPLIFDDYDQWDDHFDGPPLFLNGIDWLIVGGESGPQHRSIDPQWVRDLRDCCLPSCGRCERVEPDCDCEDPTFSGGHTAFFFKQWGGRTPKAGGRELDGRTWDEMPEAIA